MLSRELIEATESGDIELIKKLSSEGHNIRGRNSVWDKKTLLHIAAEHNQVGVLNYLIDCSLPIDSAMNNGYTPLMIAASTNSLDAATFLITQKANVLYRAPGSLTALDLAKRKPFKEMITLLQNAELHALSEAKKLEQAKRAPEMLIKENAELQKRIIELERQMKTEQQFFDDMLLDAAKQGDTGRTELALHGKANVNVRDENGESPIFHSLLNRKIDVSEKLLQEGADLEYKNNSNQTILDKVCENQNLATVKFIVNRLPKTDEEATILFSALETKSTPAIGQFIVDTILFQAAKQGNPSLLEKALCKGANIRATTEECGETALHIASRFGHNHIVKILLMHHACTFAEDNRRCKPMDLAISPTTKTLITDYQTKYALFMQSRHRGNVSRHATNLLRKKHIIDLQEESAGIFSSLATQGKFDEIAHLSHLFKTKRYYQLTKEMRDIPKKEIKDSGYTP